MELTDSTYKWIRGKPFSSEVDPGVTNARFVAYGIVAPIIVSVGMLGNLLTIFILRLPQFRGVTYTYFLTLAVSDFLSLFFCISFLHHMLLQGTYLYSTAVWYSYFEQLVVNIPMSTSVLVVMCVTVDRFFSVCRPTDFKRIHTSSYARAGILSSMVIAAAVWLPTSALMKPKLSSQCETSSFVPPDNRTWWVACMVKDIGHNPYYIAYAWIRQTIISFIPIVVLILLNGLIVREFLRLRKKKDQMVGAGQLHGTSPTDGRRRDDQHLITMLTAVMISFLITMVPAGIMNALYTKALATELDFEVFRAVANNLEMVNHALNFYLYILCSKPIREAIKTFFHKRQGVPVSTPGSNVIEVVQQAKDFSSGPNASTPKANISYRKQGLEEGGGITHREKSKTMSKETEPSDVPSDINSSLDDAELKVDPYTNEVHLHRKPLEKPVETPHLNGSAANTVDDEVNNLEYGCGPGFLGSQQNPSLECSDTSSDAVEGNIPQSVGAASTPAQAPVLEGSKTGYCNEAFTFDE